MDKQFQLLFDKIKVEIQTQIIEETNTMLEKMEEKLKSVVEDGGTVMHPITTIEKYL